MGLGSLLRGQAPSRPQGTDPTGCGGEHRRKVAISITGVLWLFVGACVIYYMASTANEVYPPRAFLGTLAVLIAISGAGLVAGRKLLRLAAVGVPALLFALAMAAPTFAIFSVATSLNEWMRPEAQQAAMAILWAYVGVAFMIGEG